MVRVLNNIEERLTEQSITALKILIGEELYIRMPRVSAYADGSISCDRMDFAASCVAGKGRFVTLQLEELESRVTRDHYYRIHVQAGEVENLASAFESSWSYQSGPVRSSIGEIEVYSYDSLPDQMKAWPESETFEEARSYDYELLLKMDDGGRVSVKPMHNDNLIYLTLKPSFELLHYRRTLGENLNLRITIN